MSRRKQQTDSTRDKALREAKDLLQHVGFNGFSFQHIAERLGINKASLYSHFESKEELGQELVADYFRQFSLWCDVVRDLDPDQKIMAFFDLFHQFSKDGFKICPLSALTIDLAGLPARVRKAAIEMSTFQMEWITAVISEGKRDKVFLSKSSNAELGRSILSLGLGAQLTARLTKNADAVKDARALALGLLQTKP